MAMITKRGEMMIMPKKMRLMLKWPNSASPKARRLPDIIKNCQKNPNMLPIDPRRRPKARGSIMPPLWAIVLKSLSGEKSTALKVW
jgi:hypothetical protein